MDERTLVESVTPCFSFELGDLVASILLKRWRVQNAFAIRGTSSVMIPSKYDAGSSRKITAIRYGGMGQSHTRAKHLIQACVTKQDSFLTFFLAIDS